MSAFDYSLTGKNPFTHQMQTIVPFTASTYSKLFNQQPSQQCGDILNLIKSEREKQYTAIRTMLHQHSALIPDITNIILSYIAAVANADADADDGH